MLARCRVHEVSQEWGCEWGSSYMNESIHSVSSHDCRFLRSRMRCSSLVITLLCMKVSGLRANAHRGGCYARPSTPATGGLFSAGRAPHIAPPRGRRAGTTGTGANLRARRRRPAASTCAPLQKVACAAGTAGASGSGRRLHAGPCSFIILDGAAQPCFPSPIPLSHALAYRLLRVPIQVRY